MRTTPLVGEKVWFSPRRFGWGLDPVSVEGWALAVSIVLLSFVARKQETGKALTRALVAGGAVVAVLKGTAPGGKRAREEFKRTQE